MEVRKLWEENESETRERFMEIKGGKGYTIADIEALPEGERAELIDGEMFRMDAPSWMHQDLLMQIAVKISLYVTNNKGKCKVLPAPFGVYIKKDNRNYVEPDISVICDMEKKSEKGCQGAPDWTIEILSPSSVKMDCERKVKLYRETGVREYWIVDPERESVTVYDFEHSKAAQKANATYGSAHSEVAQKAEAGYGSGHSVMPSETGAHTEGACSLAAKPFDEPVCYTFSDRIKAGIFPDLYVDFSEMDLS